MDIQYAVFFQDIDLLDTPHVFRNPISHINVSDLKQISSIDFPLYVTFIDGEPGIQCLSIDLEFPSGDTYRFPEYIFMWPENTDSYGDVFIVPVQPTIFGNYLFSLSVNNSNSQRLITIPILQSADCRVDS